MISLNPGRAGVKGRLHIHLGRRFKERGRIARREWAAAGESKKTECGSIQPRQVRKVLSRERSALWVQRGLVVRSSDRGIGGVLQAPTEVQQQGGRQGLVQVDAHSLCQRILDCSSTKRLRETIGL